MSPTPQKSLLGLSLAELAALTVEMGQPGYRAQQIFDSIYRQRVQSVEQISTLPSAFRRELINQSLSIGLPKIAQKFTSVDGTVRYLIACADQQTVETVWMPEGDFGEAGDGTEAGREELAQLASEEKPERAPGDPR